MKDEIITEAQQLVNSLEPLFFSLLRTAEHHQHDEVRISTARAREIHHDLLVLKKKLKSLASQNTATTLTIDRHLDAIFNINQ
jgi:hypothetical protein